MLTRHISIVGAGYVGLCTAAGFASKNCKVIIVELDMQKVNSINNAVPPFYEPGLEEVLKKVVREKNLKCTSSYEEAILNTQITFITVGTPSLPDGNIDLKFVRNSSRKIGEALVKKNEYHLVVVKSTVTPSTTNDVVKPLIEKNSKRKCGSDFGLCVNPEFLVEGAALNGVLNPDRIIIGEYDKKSGDLLESLYKDFYRENIPPIIRTNLQNAELIKYANNAFLAMKVSYINQIANLCQRIPGADVEVVAKGIGLDKRIGPLFLKAGLGWGGSCFPKDLRALLKFSRLKGTALPLTEATIHVNETQPLKAVNMAEKLLGDLKAKKVAILGLAFKPETDDVREAVSIKIVRELLRRRAKVFVYDPAAIKNVREIFGDNISYCRTTTECISNADCAIIVTEWPEFSELQPEDFASKMKRPIVIDGRRIYDPQKFSSLLEYAAVGFGSESVKLEPDENVWVNPALAINVIIEDRNKILLIKRSFEPFKGLWSLPGGYVEYGERVEDAVKREVKEECGLHVKISQIVGVYSNPKRHPWKHAIAICYAAKKVGRKIKYSTTEGKVKFFRKDEIPRKLAFDHSEMIKDYLKMAK
jgi:UDPglucose 6-dehydrogenase